MINAARLCSIAWSKFAALYAAEARLIKTAALADEAVLAILNLSLCNYGGEFKTIITYIGGKLVLIMNNAVTGLGKGQGL